jgi:CMP-N-acetylneuraminic acid synthetase
MVPARIGSTRLAMKNLALLNGRPLIYYAISAAKRSGVFDRVIINAESALFLEVAKRYGVEFYRRPELLASSTAKSDSVVYDFIRHNRCDIVVWVNTIAPLQTALEIRKAVEHFRKERLDSLITVKDEQVHCIYKGRPVNFRLKGLFAQTQELAPVQPFVYSLMMWRTKAFKKMFETKGYAFFCGKTGYYPVSKRSAMIIKKEEDLMLAEYLMRGIKDEKTYKVRYDAVIDRLKKGAG